MRETAFFIASLILFLGCTGQPEEVSILPPAENPEPAGNESSLEDGCASENPPCKEDYLCVNNSCLLKQGCDYDNPSCPTDYDCMNNECFLGKGCAYENPPCEVHYACIGNACVLDAEDEPCMECLDESPGNQCADGHCLKITPADCNNGECCSGDICIEKQGCYYENPGCSGDELCLNNDCIPKSALLPGNSESSGTCGYDEVYENGECISAAYTLHFVSKGLSQEQFNDMAESITAGFVHNTPLRDCPDKLRVHSTFQLCCGESPCTPSPDGEQADAVIYLKNNSDNQTCGPVSGVNVVSVPPADPYADTGTAVHEMGHALGLLDQYCYWPFPENPNPADYEEGKCYPLEETDGLFQYCSGNEKLPEETGVHACRGNINPLGGVSTMGYVGDPSRDYTSHPKFGFTEEEYGHIAEQVSCG